MIDCAAELGLAIVGKSYAGAPQQVGRPALAVPIGDCTDCVMFGLWVPLEAPLQWSGPWRGESALERRPAPVKTCPCTSLSLRAPARNCVLYPCFQQTFEVLDRPP